MQQYLDLVANVLINGVEKSDRTSTGTYSTFGQQLRFNLEDGFPLVTTKKIHLKSVIHELLWFVKGDTNVGYLNDNGVKIWDEWADSQGNLGPVYGKQWRDWSGPYGCAQKDSYCRTHDQLADAISRIKTNPDCRRLIVSAWNVDELGDMALAPCHVMFQFYVVNGKLSCHMYQRSADIFLGVPFNIASYALLTMMVAQVCSLGLGELVISFGDAHIYLNHIEQAKLQLSRAPRHLPIMLLDPDVRDIDDFKYEHFTLTGYSPHPAISAPVAV